MKTRMLVALSVLIVSSMALALSIPDAGGRLMLDGRLNCPFIPHSGGTAFLQISLSTSDIPMSARRPMNIAVVLDRSGSMADQRKIDYAKQAVNSLIENLQSEDIFSLVIYDDVVEVLCSAERVRSKHELRGLVENIYPRGSTNLGGGMVEGFRQAERNLGKEYVNRVILLSDGLANRGVVDPRELIRMAHRYRSKSISLSTMGVGLEYNENLMVGLSESGGGNYYFIESPHQLASMMHKEMNTLSCIVAQNASIELTLGRGVEIVDVIGCEHRTGTSRYVIPIGDLYSNDHREFTVELGVPGGTGSLIVANGVLRYDGEKRWRGEATAFVVRAQYTRDLAEVDKRRDWETQAKVDVAVSTRSVDRAMAALDGGNREVAEQELKAAEQALAAAPALRMSAAGAAAMRQQSEKLRSYNEVMKDSRNESARAKKSIQYDNYKTQKQK